METVIVERNLEHPLDLGLLADNRDRIVSCLQAHDVRLLHSYLAPDRRRMICVYQGPDAESVRTALRRHGLLSFEHVWKASVIRPQDIDAFRRREP